MVSPAPQQIIPGLRAGREMKGDAHFNRSGDAHFNRSVGKCECAKPLPVHQVPRRVIPK